MYFRSANGINEHNGGDSLGRGAGGGRRKFSITQHLFLLNSN